MSLTGQLGTADSRPGNVVPGLAGSFSPPVPPVVPPSLSASYYVPPRPRLTRFAFSFPASPPSEFLFQGLYPVEPVAGAQEAAAAAREVYPVPFNPGPRRDGPYARLPRLVEHRPYDVEVPAPPPAQVFPRPVPPFNLSGMRVLFPLAPRFTHFYNPDAPVPVPPTVPPPPPPPQTGTIGAPRVMVPSIPRAPAAEDPRVRPHIDKVATLLNDLLRKGYIRQVGNGDFEVIGGGFALPRAPVPTDDSSVGAVVGATFVDTTTQNVYVCVNNSVGSSVWKLVG